MAAARMQCINLWHPNAEQAIKRTESRRRNILGRIFEEIGWLVSAERVH